MKRIFYLILLCILCAMLLVGCANSEGDEYTWPKDIDDKSVYALHKWVLEGKTVNMDFTAKLDNTTFTQYKLNEKSLDASEENVESSIFSSSTTSFTVANARQMLSDIEAWIKAERAELATDYNISFLLPRFTFIGGEQDTEGVERYIYSISSGSIEALDGEYMGSEAFGSLGITHQYPPADILSSAQEGIYTNYAVNITLYIDE